jgi:hypothetical protein
MADEKYLVTNYDDDDSRENYGMFVFLVDTYEEAQQTIAALRAACELAKKEDEAHTHWGIWPVDRQTPAEIVAEWRGLMEEIHGPA